MNWGIGLILIGVIACALFVWYLCRRSENETSENEEVPTDDGYEDLLLTGLMLEEIYDDNDASDDMDSDGYDGFDGGYDDTTGLE
jgi:hypothetical protein